MAELNVYVPSPAQNASEAGVDTFNVGGGAVGSGTEAVRQVVVVGDSATKANVQTVDASGRAAVAEADGANVTIGAKADTLALTGTVTLMSLVKGLISLIPQSLGQKTMANSMSVSLASDQTPIADKTFSGTLMNASGSLVTISMEGYQGLVLHVVHNNLTASIQVKGSGDGGSTFNMPVYMGTSAIGGTPLYTQTAGIGYASDSSTLDFYIIPAEGITHYQVSFSAYTSGSTTVTPRASAIGWQFGPPVVSTDGTFDGGVGPFLRVGGQRSDSNDTYIHFNNATAPGSSDWGIITRDQANGWVGLIASAVTSPASASTALGAALTGLDKLRSVMITARLLGATGGTLDVYLQASPDAGTTWFDIAHFPQLAAAATVKAYTITLSRHGTSGAAPLVVNGVDGTPSLTVNTVVQGDWGDRIRYVFVAGASTSAGAAQTIKLTGTT